MTNPRKSPPVGAIGRNVARNVKELRAARKLSLRALSGRLDALERPITPVGLLRLETAERRVDSDDLAALAVALGVSPSALMLPRDAAPAEEIELAPGRQARAADAWRWADGVAPLPDPDAETGLQARRGREADFLRHSRPAGIASSALVAEIVDFLGRAESVLAAPDPATWDMQMGYLQRGHQRLTLALADELAAICERMTEESGGTADFSAVQAQLQQAMQALPAPAVSYAEPSRQAEEKRS